MVNPMLMLVAMHETATFGQRRQRHYETADERRWDCHHGTSVQEIHDGFPDEGEYEVRPYVIGGRWIEVMQRRSLLIAPCTTPLAIIRLASALVVAEVVAEPEWVPVPQLLRGPLPDQSHYSHV